MDWVHETHRRIYTRVDGKWTRHPLSARGLGSELLKYVDEDGCIYLAPGETPADAIFRVTQAHASERKRVQSDVASLIESKPHDPPYLIHDADLGRVRVRNFHSAQGIVPQSAEERSAERSKEADRAAKYRKRKKQGLEGSVERDVDRDARDDRHDEKRDGDRDAERDAGRDESRDALAGAAARAYACAGTVPSVPSVPSHNTSTPRGPNREGDVGDGRPSVPEATEEDPLVPLLAGAHVFAGENIPRIAGAARLLVRGRRDDDEVFEIADFAASAVVRAVGSKGVGEGKAGAYFLKTFEGLLADGGLETAKDERAPRTPRSRGGTSNHSNQGPVEFDPNAFLSGRQRRRAGGES